MKNTLNCIKNYKIKLSSIEISVKEWGCPSGHVMLALHGWLDNMASYYPMLNNTDWLIDNNIRLITIDWPGHGHSDHRLNAQQYHLLEYVQDLDELIEALELSRVSFIAHSMGGAIASLYSGSFPERVEKLILLEGLSPITQPASEGPEQLAKAILSRRKVPRKSLFKDFQAIVRARKQGTDLSKESVTMLLERNLIKTDEGYRWRSDPRVRLPSHLRLTPAQSQAFISNLTMPVLLLYGEDGFIKTYPVISKLISMYQHIKTIKLKGGHHFHMQYPEMIIKEIVKFIQIKND